MNEKNTHHFTVRMSKQLVQRAKIKAAMEGITISAFIRDAMEKWVKDIPFQLRLPDDDK